MFKQTFLIIICSAIVNLHASDQYVTIGTNRFGFAFEDMSLSTNMQMRIIDDWKVMTAPWTNIAVSVNGNTNSIVGNLKFRFVENTYLFREKGINYNTYDLLLSHGESQSDSHLMGNMRENV